MQPLSTLLLARLMALDDLFAGLRGGGLRNQSSERSRRCIARLRVTFSRRGDIEEGSGFADAGDRAADGEITYLLALEIELVFFGVKGSGRGL